MISQHDLPPNQIWNMDETGIQLEHRSKKTVDHCGSRYLHACTSGIRELITVIAACNASGTSLPPHLIVNGKSCLVLHGFDSEKAPEDTVMSTSDSRWTKQGISALWFERVFLANIGTQRPQLLILDGHDSHHYVELIEAAMKENIILVELPAHTHTSHWLQLLDCAVFFSLKSHYNEACQKFLNSYLALTILHANFCRGVAIGGRLGGLGPPRVKMPKKLKC